MYWNWVSKTGKPEEERILTSKSAFRPCGFRYGGDKEGFTLESINRYVEAYKEQVQKGDIVKAYRELMRYILNLRTHLAGKYPGYAVSGVYFGYMDMTYFSFTPEELKNRNLKIALVFVHDTCRWEAWLAAANRRVRTEYLRRFRDKGWSLNPVSPDELGVDSIVECMLVKEPDFDDRDGLTRQIETGVLQWIEEIRRFLGGD